jgi:hypothetical protein
MRRPIRGDGGFSLVDLVASIGILVVGLMSLAAGFHGAANLASETRDNYLLTLSERNVLAELKGSTFEDLTKDYATSTGKDTFWIGLDGSSTTAGTVNRTTLPVGIQPPTGTIFVHDSETILPLRWGGILLGGLDLNLDGLLNLLPILDYGILPVRIVVTVQGVRGPRTLETQTILTRPRI